MLQFGLRLGDWPRQMVTTTPRPTPLVKQLIAAPTTALTRALTRDNAANLAPGFLETIVAHYAGTRLGRQELDGELIDERRDALWTRDMLEAARVTQAPALTQIVVAVDPPASATKRADHCGVVAAGVDAEGAVHVLADASLGPARPAQWARAAIALYHRLKADALVAEVNQGGDMVRAVLHEADPAAPVTMVRATRGKYLRAAPVAQLYEQKRVKHVGAFPALEDEMCDFGPDGLSSGRSPDRLDRFDNGATVTIKFGAGQLSSVGDDAALAGRSSIAIRGVDGAWEILAFARAELVDASTYRLSRLIRGLGGETTLAARTTPAGATAVLMDDALTPLTTSVAEIGAPQDYAVGPAHLYFDDPLYVRLTATATNLSLRPYAPTYPRARRQPEGVEISFIRRTRINGDAWDIAEAPLGETVPAFEADITTPAGIRLLKSATDSFLYPAPQEIADFGAPQRQISLSLYQLSEIAGRGFPLSLTLTIEQD